jgi:pyruvate formate lyase activating enzyme
MDELARLLKPFTCIERVELLPYHTMAAEKYKSLGRDLPLPGVPAADPAHVRHLEAYLRERWA